MIIKSQYRLIMLPCNWVTCWAFYLLPVLTGCIYVNILLWSTNAVLKQIFQSSWLNWESVQFKDQLWCMQTRLFLWNLHMKSHTIYSPKRNFMGRFILAPSPSLMETQKPKPPPLHLVRNEHLVLGLWLSLLWKSTPSQTMCMVDINYNWVASAVPNCLLR